MNIDKFDLSPENTAYVIIDMQEKLGGAMPQDMLTASVGNVVKMAQACNAFGIPIIAARQYPKGLGEIIPEINTELKSAAIVDKMDFSAANVPEFKAELAKLKNVKNIIISGMETHVCVLQTTIDLLKAGYNVHIIEDSCVSRTPERKSRGLEYMKQAGAVISNAEIAMFDFTISATSQHFKTISNIVK